MRTSALSRVGVALVGCVMALAAGCASPRTAGDPYEKTNRFVYHVNDAIDRAVLKPAADLYVKVIPRPVRTGVGNAFGNVGYANVILNDFLQGQWKQGWNDTARMATNTTVGLLGVFDPASDWGLPAHRNDFGITWGKWGAGPGPYLVLPVLGPSTVRDVPGIGVAAVTNPLFWLNLEPAVSIPIDVTGIVDARARADADIRFRQRAAIDPYVFTRDAYLRSRAARIGGTPAPPDESFYDEGLYREDAGPATAPTSRR